MSSTATQQLPGPTRTRGGYWLGKGWDWLLEDLGVYSLLGLLALLFLSVSQGLLYGPVAALLAAAGLRRISDSGRDEGEPPKNWSQRLSDDFAATFQCFLPALLSGLLVLCFSFVGLVFLIIPGIVIFAMYLFTFHFIVDQRQDFWQAMESSRRLVSRDYFGFSLFTVVLVGINLLGLLFVGIGLILTLAISSLAITAAYRDCTGGASDPEPEPPAAPIIIE